MMVAYSALKALLKKNIQAVYVITGSEAYLSAQAVREIKTSWKALSECDELILNPKVRDDWLTCLDEANSYSLFTPHRLIDIRVENKSLDAPTKKLLSDYADQPNLKSLLVIQAPLWQPKQIDALSKHTKIAHVHVSTMSPKALYTFVCDELTSLQLKFIPDVVHLIQTYNQNNLLACAQVIQQLGLIYDPHTTLTPDLLMGFLVDHSEFGLFDLADAMLTLQTHKAIHRLRQLRNTKSEPSLVLWLISQELRQIINLGGLLNQGITSQQAYQDLKIWSSKAQLYETALKRAPMKHWYGLLKMCKEADEYIKTGQVNLAWNTLEGLCLQFSITEFG